MTKKDYELIADCLAYNLGHANEYQSPTEAIKAVILDLQLRLDEDNPKFDRNKFLEACGVVPSPDLAKLQQDGQRYKALKRAAKEEA